MATMQDIYNLFDRYGWQYHKEDENTVLVGFKGELYDFIMGARLYNEWFTLTLPDYLPTVPEHKQAEVYRYALNLNKQISFVKLAFESDDKITFMVNLPAGKKLDYDLFSLAIDTLTFYGEDAYPHLYKKITGELPPPSNE